MFPPPSSCPVPSCPVQSSPVLTSAVQFASVLLCPVVTVEESRELVGLQLPAVHLANSLALLFGGEPLGCLLWPLCHGDLVAAAVVVV